MSDTTPPDILYLDCRLPFRRVAWSDLQPGDVIYYLVVAPWREETDAHGPFVVVDPVRGRLRNGQGIELDLPRVVPLMLAGER